MGNKILKWLVYPIISIVSSYLLRDTPYAIAKDRIGKDDFGIIKDESYPNENTLVRTYFIKNMTNYPINAENCSLEYTSTTIPQKVTITNSNNVSLPLKFVRNKNEIFNIALPTKLKNEDYFFISIIYSSKEKIEDKLILKVVSDEENKYVTYGEGDVTIDTMFGNAKASISVYKTIIVVETCLLIYFLLVFATNAVNSLIVNRKQEKDRQILTDPNNQFINLSND